MATPSSSQRRGRPKLIEKAAENNVENGAEDVFNNMSMYEQIKHRRESGASTSTTNRKRHAISTSPIKNQLPTKRGYLKAKPEEVSDDDDENEVIEREEEPENEEEELDVNEDEEEENNDEEDEEEIITEVNFQIFLL